MRTILILIFIVLTANCFSQINRFYVEPIETDASYSASQDSHMVVRNATINNNRLFLFLGGTNSKTKNYFRIADFAGNLGFDVINLSYINDVAAASLKNSTDNLAFDNYRQEICYGTPQSSFVSVDTFNSINTRTIKLINYLHTTYPAQSWDQYLVDPTTLDWSKITIGGHSQGGGHAAYFAKYNNADRVLMFSSPNDYSDHFSAPANWLGISGLTSINKHFAYLSLLDEAVDFSKQLSNLQGLGLYPLYDTTYVDNSSTPYDNSHCLYTTQSPGLAILHHNSPTRNSTINDAVWEYMLTTPIDETTSINEAVDNSIISIYPNPTSSEITILLNEDMRNKNYIVRNVNGQVVLEGKIINPDLLKIDLSSVEKGIYILSIENQAFKIIKQ